jgi:phosphoenolpyruvate carboxykinase (ATP)
VPDNILIPRNTWEDKDAYDETITKLVHLFQDNFAQYEEMVHPDIVAAGPTGAKVK